MSRESIIHVGDVAMAEIILETKLVGAINGAFHVASYQRGYRWGPEEVKRLLDDVYTNGNQDYCLQPIVVKKNGDAYELIDGQQRLTTLYLIYKYMHNASGGFLDEPQFSITYETREKSQEFLTDIDMRTSTSGLSVTPTKRLASGLLPKRKNQLSLISINTSMKRSK